MRENLLGGIYKIIREIGHGGSGTLYLAYHTRLEIYVVVKHLHRTSRKSARRNEADILKGLRHQNLPQVYDFLSDEAGNVYIVMNYIDGFAMSRYIESRTICTQQQISRWLRQLSGVLDYLHSHQPPILHCDIKPENIMITPTGDAILIDFGISLIQGQNQMQGISKDYASPEQLYLAEQLTAGANDQISLDARTDLYSLAASFFHLMSGTTPSPHVQMPTLRSMNTPYGHALTDIIDKALRYRREERMASAADMLRAVERLTPRERGYRNYLLYKCASFLLSATLLSAGIYCLVVSSYKQTEEQYAADFQAVFSAVDSNNIIQAKERGRLLLSRGEYQEILTDNPQDRFAIWSALGDLDYAEANYAAAAGSYSEAAHWAAPTDMALCIRNQIAALAQAGQPAQAKSVLDSEEALYMTEEDRLYASAVIAAEQGQSEECKQYARQLMERGNNRDLVGRAALAAASVSEDSSEELYWLTQAEQCGSVTVIRGLALAYAHLAMETDGEQSRVAIERSLSYYRSLTSSLYPSKTDRLNYAAALRISGDLDGASHLLEQLLVEYPEDYRVLMYLAFLSEEKGDNVVADYCQRALAAWHSDTSENRESQESANIQSLLALADRYGIMR